MRRVFAVILLAASCLAAAEVSAQPAAAVNPTTVEFDPSADHSVINPLNGLPMLARYELRMFLESDLTTMITSADLGKPAPATDGKIRVTNPVWFAALTPKTRYVAKVAAIGPTGEGVSDPSGPFGNVGPPAKTAPPVLR